MLAEFGAVIVALYVELADGVNAEKLAAGSAGRHVVFGGAGEFDAIEQEEILLRAIAVDGVIAGGGGVGDAGAADFLRSEIDDAGIECEQQIVAAAVEREILDGLLADEAGDVGGRGADHGCLSDDVKINRASASDLERDVDSRFL